MFFFIVLIEREEKGFWGILMEWKLARLSPLSHSYKSRDHQRPQILDSSFEIANLSYWNLCRMKILDRISGMKETGDSGILEFTSILEF